MDEFSGCTGSCGTCGGCGPTSEDSLPILVLTDENGKEVTFEKLDVVVLDGKSYMIVSEIKEDESDEIEVVILEIKEENGSEVFDTVSDQELSKKIYSMFLKQQGIEEE